MHENEWTSEIKNNTIITDFCVPFFFIKCVRWPFESQHVAEIMRSTRFHYSGHWIVLCYFSYKSQYAGCWCFQDALKIHFDFVVSHSLSSIGILISIAHFFLRVSSFICLIFFFVPFSNHNVYVFDVVPSFHWLFPFVRAFVECVFYRFHLFTHWIVVVFDACSVAFGQFKQHLNHCV